MRRVNLSDVMTVNVMAMLEDEENTGLFNTATLYRGDLQDCILTGTLKANFVGGKEDIEHVTAAYEQLLDTLNKAFNRSVNAPESMRLFKILDTKARYAGNNTICVEIQVATLATGCGSALYNMLNPVVNIWGTSATVFSFTDVHTAKETYGLGNALRSWKKVMANYGQTLDVIPAVRVNYVN